MSIQAVRLVTGECIVGEVSYDMQGEMRIKDPVLLLEPQFGKLLPIPYMPYLEFPDGLPVRKQDIMFTAKPEDVVVKEYQKVTSKLVTPPEKKLVV